jgi:heat-inducible transcriptional repressor
MRIKLSERQQQVLWATVRHYVATAKPVGSESLVEEFNPRVSAATIRNAMGRLEKVGLLYQPHISAGRVPSDSGYRIYVDQLIKPSDSLSCQVDQIFNQQLNWESWSLEAALRGAAQILSSISGYIALVTLPQPRPTAELRHLQILQIDPGRLMLVVVFDSYETQSIVIDLPDPERYLANDARIATDTIERELQVLSNFLNHHLRGRSLKEMITLDWSELGREFDRYADLLRSSLAELGQRCQQPISTQILISGIAEVLRRHPEFSELHQVQTIIQFLEEEPDQLWPLIFEVDSPDTGGSKVTVRIGSENPLEPIRTCALVSAIYQRGDVPVGSVGMLGPTRMVYEDAIALVETTANYLSDTMNQAI